MDIHNCIMVSHNYILISIFAQPYLPIMQLSIFIIELWISMTIMHLWISIIALFMIIVNYEYQYKWVWISIIDQGYPQFDGLIVFGFPYIWEVWVCNRHHCDALQRRHNGHDGVSNHQPYECLLTVFSGADQRKHQSSASLAFAWGISSHKGSVTRKIFSIWWRHHEFVNVWLWLTVHILSNATSIILSLYTYIHRL